MEFHKYHKIRQLGHDENKDIFLDGEDEITIQEKIDGGNFRFYITKEGLIIFGSRTQQLTSNEGEDDNVSKNFKRCLEFIRDTIKGKDLTPYSSLIFYGECCVKHTLSYDWEKIPPFLGFDILTGNGFMHYANVEKVFEELGLPLVPLINRVYAKEIKTVTDAFVPVSAYAPRADPTQLAEGVVFKNYNKQLFAKYVRDAFKEKNREAFRGNPKYNGDDYNDNAIIAHKYCTNARIEKIIFKLVDEGEVLDIPLMKYLPKRLWTDIAEEEWIEILNSKWIMDLPRLRKLLTKRCLAVLRQVVTNNALTD